MHCSGGGGLRAAAASCAPCQTRPVGLGKPQQALVQECLVLQGAHVFLMASGMCRFRHMARASRGNSRTVHCLAACLLVNSLHAV